MQKKPVFTVVLCYDLAVDWADIIKSEKKNIFHLNVFLKEFNLILDKYLPLKKLTKQKLKFKTEPWITPGLQKSISIKNKLLTKFIKLREPTLKNEARTKDSTSTVQSTTIEDNISLTNPKDIADAFNNYFSNVATGIKSCMKYSRNKFFDFLPQIKINSFFINPTDKTEIKKHCFVS